jgi:hypothetical protein
MADTTWVATIRAKFERLRPFRDERRLRLRVAPEALALGRGGVTTVAEQRARGPGDGRKPLASRDPGRLHDLEALVEPLSRGDPMSPLRWTWKSAHQLADALGHQGHRVNQQTVAELLRALDDRLLGTRKAKEGVAHLDRDAQFGHINAQVRAFQARGQPVISVDTKKNELVGDVTNGGREWHPAGQPELVRVQDFVDRELGKAIPYGVYDIAANRGRVSVGTDHDTPAFAVESLRGWSEQMGRPAYPATT